MLTDAEFAAQLQQWERWIACRVHAVVHSRGFSREDIEDVIQDVRLVAWRTRGNYNPARGCFSVWLTYCIRRVLCHRARKLDLRAIPFSALDGAELTLARCASVPATDVSADALIALAEHRGLSVRTGAELRLRMDGYSDQEIAGSKGVASGVHYRRQAAGRFFAL